MTGAQPMGGSAETPVLWTSTFTSGTLAHQVAAVSGLSFDLRFISLRVTQGMSSSAT